MLSVFLWSLAYQSILYESWTFWFCFVRPWVPWEMFFAVVIWLIGFVSQSVQLYVACYGQWSGYYFCFQSPCVTCEHYLGFSLSSVLKDFGFVPHVHNSRVTPEQHLNWGIPFNSLLSVVVPNSLLFFFQEYWISLGNFSWSSCCSIVS